jgi:hypothetical protein
MKFRLLLPYHFSNMLWFETLCFPGELGKQFSGLAQRCYHVIGQRNFLRRSAQNLDEPPAFLPMLLELARNPREPLLCFLRKCLPILQCLLGGAKQTLQKLLCSRESLQKPSPTLPANSTCLNRNLTNKPWGPNILSELFSQTQTPL